MPIRVRLLHRCPVLLAVLGIAAVIGLAVLPTRAAAQDIPPIYHITVTPNYGGSALVAPGPLTGTTYTVTILNDNWVPMTNVVVQFVFPGPDIRVCADAVHMAVTDATGSCQIQLRAAGCINQPTLGACTVVANGVQIFMFTKVKSPDNASHTGSQPSGTVTIADLIFFAQEFQGMVPAACHDYTNDGQVSTADLPTFGDAFKAGLTCSLLP